MKMADESIWDALVGSISDGGSEGVTSYPVSSGGSDMGVDISSLAQDPDWGDYLRQLVSPSSGSVAEAAPSTDRYSALLERAYSDPSRSYDVLPSGPSPRAVDSSFGGKAMGWLERLGKGDKSAESQAKLGIGALGLLDSFLRNKKVGRGYKSPAELRAMTAGRFNNWTPQQQVSADRYFGGGRQFAYQKPSGMADGGPVPPPRYEPKVGTMGPRRGQTGEYDTEAVLRAIAAANAVSTPAPRNLPSSSLRTRVRRYAPENREAIEAAGGYADGGEIDASMLIEGNGGGQDDTVPINASNGEYVIDADAVSALGDGSNEEGARRLDQMVQMLRQHKRSAPPSEIPPEAAPPLSYIGRE